MFDRVNGHGGITAGQSCLVKQKFDRRRHAYTAFLKVLIRNQYLKKKRDVLFSFELSWSANMRSCPLEDHFRPLIAMDWRKSIPRFFSW